MRTPRLIGPLLALVLVSACAGTDDDPTIQVPSSLPTTPVPTSTAAEPTATLSPGVDQVVRVAYADGEVTGPDGRVKVTRGDTVQLLVTSDTADEIHLHGYDKSVDVAAGGTASLAFTASIPGVFVVELEHHKVTLVRLQVQ